MSGGVATPVDPDAPERERRGHQHHLGQEQHGATVVAVGQRTRERSDHRGREEGGERADPHPDRGVGQLVEHVGHGDGLHPRARVRTQRGREEEREVAVAQRRQGAAGAPGCTGGSGGHRANLPVPHPEHLFVPACQDGGWWCTRPAFAVRGRARLPSTPTPRGSASRSTTRAGSTCVATTCAAPTPCSTSWSTRCRGSAVDGSCTTAWSTTPASRTGAPRPEPLPHPVLGRVPRRAGGALRRHVRRGRVQLLPRRARQRGPARRPRAARHSTTRSSRCSRWAPPDRSGSAPVDAPAVRRTTSRPDPATCS